MLDFDPVVELFVSKLSEKYSLIVLFNQTKLILLTINADPIKTYTISTLSRDSDKC